jgi:glycosyltransferase involved in cell wall biosynthesis
VSGRRRSAARPTISVLIPVRDGAAYLAEAIGSALSQSHRPTEVIVVDDGSQDDTGEVAARFGSEIVYLRQAPLGSGAARNRAVEASSGDLLAFLDADDVFLPRRLERQVQVLIQDPSVEAVFGRVTEFIEGDLPTHADAALRHPMSDVPSHLATAMLIRRAAFERVGRFEIDQDVNVTVEWYARAQDAGLRSVMLDDLVLRRRLHAANIGMTRWDAGHELVRIARESIERRRADGEGR